MDFITIQIGIEKNVARIALNRPDVRNALNEKMITELTEAVEWLDCRDDIRVIEICGNGKTFCAGADIQYMKRIGEYDYDRNLDDARRLSSLFQKIYYCKKPIISMVHGAVIGGGNGITAASDIVLAVRDTRFAFSEVRLGITPATISPFVLRRCGVATARDLMLSGRIFSADEALRYGLVTFVGDLNEVNERMDFYIKHFLEASPHALQDCKYLIEKVNGTDTDMSAFEETAVIIARERMSDDGQEGLTSFLEKRKPYWCPQ